jgi:hypothetical protein
MPAPTPFSYAAYAVISIVPIVILVWYWMMYSKIGKQAIKGSGTSRGARPLARPAAAGVWRESARPRG